MGFASPTGVIHPSRHPLRVLEVFTIRAGIGALSSGFAANTERGLRAPLPVAQDSMTHQQTFQCRVKLARHIATYNLRQAQQQRKVRYDAHSKE